MTFPSYERLDWKNFERLCADLLEAEGFIIESEPFVDRKGADLIAVEIYQSHEPTRQVRKRWRVQCKHYAGSGRNLGRKEIEEALFNYGANRGPDDGLFLIVDTDYTESAKETVDQYTTINPGAIVTIWNQRQLTTRLERHPHLLARYNLPIADVDYLSAISSLKRFGNVRTLLISDQSPLAHNLTSGLRAAGFDLTFLPFWNYTDLVRMELSRSAVLLKDYRLVICFLGDSFGFPLPSGLIEIILRCHNNGAALLLFPFLAWSINRGLYSQLEKIIPVELQDPTTSPFGFTVDMVAGSYRHGDFRWLLAFDSFAEDQYVEFDPAEGHLPFCEGINSRFGISHSFEYLTVRKTAELVWADTTGNPLIVINHSEGKKVCYLNTCGHSCMNLIPISSPLEVTPQFGVLVRNVLEWLLD